MVSKLGNLNETPIWAYTAEAHSSRLEAASILVVKLEAVAVALLNLRCTVGKGGLAALFQSTGIYPQTHGTTHPGDIALVGHQINHGILRRLLEFRAIGILKVQDIAGELDTHHLHPQT